MKLELTRVGLLVELANHYTYVHQDNAPVHNSILFTDYLTKMGIKTVP